LLVAACVVGFSRVAVNTHFLTDVIAGAVPAWPTTWWVRQRFTTYGLFFTKGGAGEYTLVWPGLLIPVAAYPHIQRILSPDEPTPRRVGGYGADKKAAPWANA
jgi:membrane-associated phospholipid phosphatase